MYNGFISSYGGEWEKEETNFDLTRSVSAMSDHESAYTGGRQTSATSRRSSVGLISEAKDTNATSRPISAKSDASMMSDFLGGRRMETLLQALGCDRKSGDVIKKFLAHTENEVFYILILTLVATYN